MSTVRIVLADDHAVVRAGIANALRELSDLEIVAELSDGSAVFATLDRVRPHMLVTDVTMPDFEPIGTIRQIRARFPELKILVVSAYDDDAYVQGLPAGFDRRAGSRRALRPAGYQRARRAARGPAPKPSPNSSER